MINGKEQKGSKHQLQEYVNTQVNHVNSAIMENTGLQNIHWLSPVKKDNYTELFDSTFRNFIDNSFFKIDKIEWENFWPMTGGPRWDGIAVADNNTLLLVEAKSYPKEAMGSGSKAVSRESRDLIEKSLQKYTGNASLISSQYYQFANRVAFTNFLNEKGIKTTLLLLNFYEDTSHTNPKCIVSRNKFINQSKQMISAIGANHQSNVASIYIKAL